MRHLGRRGLLSLALAAAGAAACSSDSVTGCCTSGDAGLRIVNAFPSTVDVLIDGRVAATGVVPGSMVTASASSGAHGLQFRPSGAPVSSSRSISASASDMRTFAAVRLDDGTVGTVALDDTNAVVPAGATKVRVIHFAPNAGDLQVYRTQPDWGSPTQWQFPFRYQPAPTTLGAPFFQSTVGTWEIRVWQTPADSTGWANAPVKVSLALASGEKRTVLILDNPGGGVQVEVY